MLSLTVEISKHKEPDTPSCDYPMVRLILGVKRYTDTQITRGNIPKSRSGVSMANLPAISGIA